MWNTSYLYGGSPQASLRDTVLQLLLLKRGKLAGKFYFNILYIYFLFYFICSPTFYLLAKLNQGFKVKLQ